MRKFTHTSAKKTNEPSPEQIARHKNFNALSKQHRKLVRRPKKQLYKDPKMALFIVLLGVLAWLLFS
jgi:hypothetical protein